MHETLIFTLLAKKNMYKRPNSPTDNIRTKIDLKKYNNILRHRHNKVDSRRQINANTTTNTNYQVFLIIMLLLFIHTMSLSFWTLITNGEF